MSVVLGHVLVDGALRVPHTRKAAAPDPFLAKRKLANFATRTLNVRGGREATTAWGSSAPSRPDVAGMVSHPSRGYAGRITCSLTVWGGVSQAATRYTFCIGCLTERGSPGRSALTRCDTPLSTSILNQTGDLELVRQVLRHESLVSRTPVGSTRPMTRLNANNTLQLRRR